MHFQTAVKSCSQGGVRGGAATLFYPLVALEVESLLVLKNNRGVEDNRVRHMDYGVQINKLMYTRLIKGGDITAFPRPKCRACMMHSSPIRTNSSVSTPNTSKTQPSANAFKAATDLFS
jgi:ribonucleotide reductase alpha subunit